MSDPDNCRQRETELGCGQSNKRRERGNKVHWSQACIITTVERSTIWHRQQGIQRFMKGELIGDDDQVSMIADEDQV